MAGSIGRVILMLETQEYECWYASEGGSLRDKYSMEARSPKEAAFLVIQTFPDSSPKIEVYPKGSSNERYSYVVELLKNEPGLGIQLSDPVIPIEISTTPSIPNSTITQTHGIVFGEAIMGANILRDIAGSLRDVFGGRSGAYESKLKQGRSIALQELMDEARNIGANAVVGVSIDYETIGNSNSMLMICASGTAVTVENSINHLDRDTLT